MSDYLPMRPDAFLQQPYGEALSCAKPPQRLLTVCSIEDPAHVQRTAAQIENHAWLVQDLWRCQRQAPLPSNAGFLATPVTGVASRSGKLRLLR